MAKPEIARKGTQAPTTEHILSENSSVHKPVVLFHSIPAAVSSAGSTSEVLGPRRASALNFRIPPPIGRRGSEAPLRAYGEVRARVVTGEPAPQHQAHFIRGPRGSDGQSAVHSALH